MYFQTIEYIIKLYHKEVIVMIETRQNSYLVRYAVKLLIFTEIFMFMTIIILYGTLEKIIPTFLEKILYGYMSITGYLQYIIHFKNAKIYFFELSAKTKRTH